MGFFKKFEDILNSLKDEGKIYTDERYHWWQGVIDGCFYCGIIDYKETNTLLEQLEKQLQ
jgi:hypothetical protein